ncbi:hypothetical protein [Methylobacterium gregans]|uniref:Uncharacterized protein n=1 Tax=Methylobacterium gregans TaxID=374424 RepID=A0AA37HNT1_9HYPH|nr:hypothetical protein [Methylobacterium gregans]MDQ0523847.1 hypothetical protein [Methylobacterium gregans]GJD78187.1 hypothetical protein NBEOAGPD_1401 [Methylobacterium gregans]GLS54726.1 hypothetical protein GCM10007886_29090 [Methylobacterium gregans]
MRQCGILSPNRSSVTGDPQLNGIGHALEQLYAPVLAEGVPEAWLRLLGRAGAPNDPGRAEDAARDPTRPPSPGGTRS